MEVLDVSVLSAEPVPRPFIFRSATVTSTGSHHELEAVLLKVDLDEYGNNLVVIIDNINVFSDSMFLRKSTSLNPDLLVNRIVVALICLITSEHQNVT